MEKHYPTLFCAVFLIVGLAILGYMPVRKLYQYNHAQSWVETQAQIVSAKLRYGTLGGSNSGRLRRRGHRAKQAYEAVGKYTYTYNGTGFTGTRLTLSEGLSTDRSHHAKLVSRLKSHKRQNKPIVAYFNPARPDQSVLDRSADWFGILIGSVLGFVFSGLGIGFYIFMGRTR